MATGNAMFPYWLGNYPQPLPYGCFTSSSDQEVSGANVTLKLTYDTTETASQTYYVGSKIYVQATGIYRVLFTIQTDTSSGGQQSVLVWFVKNGVNVPRSASTYTIQNNGANIAACETILPLLSGDYIEIAMQSPDANMTAEFTAAGGVAPNDYPAVPSIITTIQKIA